MNALGSSSGWVLALSSLFVFGACADDKPDGPGTGGTSNAAGTASTAGTSAVGGSNSAAGTTSTGGASAGTAGSNGTSGSSTGGSSGGGDLSALCSTVCTRYQEACPNPSVDPCAMTCQNMQATIPAGCVSLQVDYLSCLSTRPPMCGSNGWHHGYEDVCDAKGRTLCIITKGAECIAGESYDDVLCQSGEQGMYGYYCQQGVAPKPGCRLSTTTTRLGLHCCDNRLSL